METIKENRHLVFVLTIREVFPLPCGIWFGYFVTFLSLVVTNTLYLWQLITHDQASNSIINISLFVNPLLMMIQTSTYYHNQPCLFFFLFITWHQSINSKYWPLLSHLHSKIKLHPRTLLHVEDCTNWHPHPSTMYSCSTFNNTTTPSFYMHPFKVLIFSLQNLFVHLPTFHLELT